VNNWLKMSAIFIILLVSIVNNGYSASIESQLQNLARETRKSLPMRIGDDDIQATNITVVGKTVLSTYNFLRKKSQLGNINNVKPVYYKSSVNTACTNPDTLKMLKLGVSFVYEYYDVDNIFVMTFTIDQNTCRGLK